MAVLGRSHPIQPYYAPPPGLAFPQSILIGTATETNTALDITGGVPTRAARRTLVVSHSRRVAGAALVADNAQVRVPTVITVELGAATETDAAQAFGQGKAQALGTTVEADTAPALTGVKARALGVATETDLAQGVAPVKAQLVGTATETDTAQAFGRAKTLAIGVVSETDSALEVTPTGPARTTRRIHVITRARRGAHTVVATDAGAGFGVPLLTLGTATETGEALPLTVVTPPPQKPPLVVSGALAAPQTHRARPGQVFIAAPPVLASPMTVALGAATETDTAQPVTRPGLLGVATETDTARPITARKTKALGTATETDTAQELTRVKVRGLGTTTETDTAPALGRRKTHLIGAAVETDTARPVGFSGYIITVGTALQANTALPLGRVKARTIGVAAEIDTARVLNKRLLLGVAAEADSAQPITRAKARLVGTTTETSIALAVGHRWSRTLGIGLETGTALTVVGFGGAPTFIHGRGRGCVTTAAKGQAGATTAARGQATTETGARGLAGVSA